LPAQWFAVKGSLQQLHTRHKSLFMKDGHCLASHTWRELANRERCDPRWNQRNSVRQFTSLIPQGIWPLTRLEVSVNHEPLVFVNGIPEFDGMEDSKYLWK
jgi:hypothetical protein